MVSVNVDTSLSFATKRPSKKAGSSELNKKEKQTDPLNIWEYQLITKNTGEKNHLPLWPKRYNFLFPSAETANISGVQAGQVKSAPQHS